ncbi:hypothetical protein F11_15785 [Rhodospirillum rubrum F11]|nr:hypothetical protein F11_15785 [Rhodospirillum rubrum F11]
MVNALASLPMAIRMAGASLPIILDIDGTRWMEVIGGNSAGPGIATSFTIPHV